MSSGGNLFKDTIQVQPGATRNWDATGERLELMLDMTNKTGHFILTGTGPTHHNTQHTPHNTQHTTHPSTRQPARTRARAHTHTHNKQQTTHNTQDGDSSGIPAEFSLEEYHGKTLRPAVALGYGGKISLVSWTGPEGVSSFAFMRVCCL